MTKQSINFTAGLCNIEQNLRMTLSKAPFKDRLIQVLSTTINFSFSGGFVRNGLMICGISI